jgi:trimeric autotransporter adhesin
LTQNATVISVSASQGNCVHGTAIACNLDSLNNGAAATVTVVLKGTDNGPTTLTATAADDENDPTSSNNSGSATTTLTGGTCALTPVITSLAPNATQAGGQDFTLTVNGSGFTSASTVYWANTALNTGFVSATQLTANVPASMYASLEWAPIPVNTSGPGAGTSNVLSFTIYNTIH